MVFDKLLTIYFNYEDSMLTKKTKRSFPLCTLWLNKIHVFTNDSELKNNTHANPV